MSKELKKIRDVIVKGYKPDKIILFGSRVWGKPHKWSDYDLLVVKKGVRKERYRRGVEIGKLMRKKSITSPTDILVYNQKELFSICSEGNQLFNDIVHRGKYIYEK